MKPADLKFRYYNGEKTCPAEFSASEARWWDQERTVAARPEMACKDIEERPVDQWPKAISASDEPLESKAVALSGFLNTKQWGSSASDFEGYFNRPINSFTVQG